MGASGIEKAQAYDWSHIARRILDFYQETLDKVASPKPGSKTEPDNSPVGITPEKVA
jgi:hypothetical protein